MNEPILGKNEYRPDQYRELQFLDYLKLQSSAQTCANIFGYPVYLVGSVLSKQTPRDIDISVIIPLVEYENLFGPLPMDQSQYPEYLANVHHKSFEYTKYLHFCIDYNLDIKVCPDIWWDDKPKLLLAYPSICTYRIFYKSSTMGCGYLDNFKTNRFITQSNIDTVAKIVQKIINSKYPLEIYKCECGMSESISTMDLSNIHII